MAFCPNCGTENKDTAQFCGSCGTSMTSVQAQEEFIDNGRGSVYEEAVEAEQYGPLGKVVNALCFAIPWYVYLIAIICIPFLMAVIDSFAPNSVIWVINTFLLIPAVIIILYLMIALILGSLYKLLRAKNPVEFISKTVWKPKYRVLLLVAIVFAVISSVLWSNSTSLESGSSDFVANLAYSYCGFLVILLYVVMTLAIIAILLKFVLDRTRWCPSCGKLFALETVSRQVVDSQQISVKKTLETKNTRGDVIGTTETYIPGTRQTVETTRYCKYCGCEVVGTSTHTYENL